MELLCPDTEGVEEFYELRNHYTQYNDRISFSYDFIMCINETENGNCKSENEIYELIESLIITQYYLRESLDLSNINNFDKRPLRSELTYSN